MATYRVITDDYPTSAPKGTIIRRASIDGDRNIIGYVSSSEADDYTVSVKMEHAVRESVDTQENTVPDFRERTRARAKILGESARRALDALQEHRGEISDITAAAMEVLRVPARSKSERIARAAAIAADLEDVFRAMRKTAQEVAEPTEQPAPEVPQSRAAVWERNRVLVKVGDVISFRGNGNPTVPFVGAVTEIKRGIVYINVPLQTIQMFLCDLCIEYIERDGQEIK